MNPTQTDTSSFSPLPLFGRLRFVLVETSRAGNIGSVARAMKTMGFTDLVLVTPKCADFVNDPEAVAFASGAGDVLNNARVVPDIGAALDGCNFAAAVSARLREFSPPVWTPRAFAEHAGAAPDLRAAIVFGNERVGLPNDIVERCNVLINIPANPDYSSLNLSQAAQVLAYEARMASDQRRTRHARRRLPGRRRQRDPDRRHVRAPRTGPGCHWLSERRQPEKAHAAHQAHVRARWPGARRSQHPSRHRPRDPEGRATPLMRPRQQAYTRIMATTCTDPAPRRASASMRRPA